ncbi:tripartite tricarboxylate transporter substrate binding protein [Roseicella frigidaeris]|uniref:Tripartite tricarboxylate transporter substrate binding protein n=1 Tax=Roseicella frigidaeris TaxID=2230885 RepID=A0A327M7X6_9PROT|nr:tripartite tricarboxylate transporter substrate binding protein [Roseicella frigidaeris]RAI59411.1 tripartite tricarboxylate transporter substrate binding protein [Roseicella frigidaeris]
MTLLHRRRGLLALGAAALASPALAAFPDRPIRLVVPWLPGGSADTQFRVLSEIAAKRFGQPVVVENRPGATGTLGAQMMAQERSADGTLVGQMPISAFRLPVMTRRPSFDPIADFTYIIHLTGYVFGVVVRADQPWRTWQEFLAHAKANPGQVTYGTPGVGSTLHITMERIAQAEGIEWLHVPFKGGADNTQAVLGGQVVANADSTGWAQLVQEGRLRLLVVWTAERAKRFPEVPTLREVGIDIVADSPYGIVGPKGIDPGTVRVLHDAFRAALLDPKHVETLERFDMPVRYMGPEEYAGFARKLYAEESAIIQRMGLRID